MVHITSGNAVADKLRRWAGEPRLIVWDDESRDRQLRRLVGRDSLWLWFEADLHNQLQLLQCLDFLQAEGLTSSPHFLVDIPRTMAVEQMAGLAANKVRVTPAMLETAVRAWRAFTTATVPALLQTDLSALPHLRPAMECALKLLPNP